MVPLLLTMDLEVAQDHELAEQRAVLKTLRSDLRSAGCPLTVFTTGDASEAFARELRQLSEDGHEIGCHGLTHQPDEDFQRMPRSRTMVVLGEATSRIERTTGVRPRAFRGPRMATSAVTQSVLVETGYAADFSVCPQRLDLLTCRGAHPGWLVAPRAAYHPSVSCPYRPGSVKLLVVPLSCLGVPFVSGSLYLFGFSFMKLLFQALLAEARRTSAAIVYLFHSYEFSKFVGGPGVRRPWHHRYYVMDPVRRYALHNRLLRLMSSFHDIVPMNSARFVTVFERGKSK